MKEKENKKQCCYVWIVQKKMICANLIYFYTDSMSANLLHLSNLHILFIYGRDGHEFDRLVRLVLIKTLLIGSTNL